MAISALYAGKAIVELLEVDTFLAKETPEEGKADDLGKLKQAAARFRQADGHWASAAASCRQVVASFRNREAAAGEIRLLERDINTFRSAAEGVTELARQMEEGTLPPNGPIHKITTMVRDQDVMAEARAEAYQGLPGHLPADYDGRAT